MSERLKKVVLLLVLLPGLLLLQIPEATPAPVSDLEQKVEKIQDRYRDLVSLSFDFTQKTRSGGRTRYGAGHGAFYRPGSGKAAVMRWNYTEPDVQIILNDGKDLSMYTQKDKQLIITSAAEMQSDITYAFFTGKRNLLDEFKVIAATDRFVYRQQDLDTEAVQLVPLKPDGQIKALHFWFDKNYLVHRLLIEDHFDSITELNFTDIRLNTLPPDSPKTLNALLRLDLPQDTEIISQ